MRSGHSPGLGRRARGALGSVLVAIALLAPGDGHSDSSLPLPARALAPAFTIKSVTGEKLSLATLLEDGPVVLDFWATWCKPCQMALPELEVLHQKYASRGLRVIGISADGPRNFAKVRPTAAKLGLTFAIALDDDERLQQLYQVRGLPTSVLIARDGSIQRFRQGYLPGETAELEAALQPLLGVAPAAPADSARETGAK